MTNLLVQPLLLLLGLLLIEGRRPAKALRQPLLEFFFHWPIWAGCTSYSRAISLTDLIPLRASSATCALNSAL